MADKYDLFMIMFGLIWTPLVAIWFQLVAIKKRITKDACHRALDKIEQS